MNINDTPYLNYIPEDISPNQSSQDLAGVGGSQSANFTPATNSNPEKLESSNEVKATRGTIGGWNITISELYSGNIRINRDGYIDLNSGNVYLDGVNSIIRLGPTSGNYITLDGANQRIRSSNYSAGVSGFNIDPDLVEAQNIRARGVLQSAVFQKSIVSAIGGILLVANADALDADMTAADSSTLTVKGDTTFAVNDILRIKDGTDEEYLRVTSIASAPTYSVTRDLASAYSADANPAWKSGQAVVKQGSSNGTDTYSGGWLQLFGEGTNSPYYSVFKRTGVAYNAITEIVRIGNLNGFLDYASDEYGIAMGDSTSYVKIDPTGGVDINGYVVNSKGAFGGDGSDGALSTSGGTVDIDLSSAALVSKNYSSITIATNNLTFSNPATTGTIVYLKSKGDVTISSSIVASALGGSGGAASTAGSGGVTTITGNSNFGLAGQKDTSAGGDEAGGVGGAAITYLNNLAGKYIRVNCGAGGGGGGAGSTGAGGAGGKGGGAIIIECAGALNFTGTITVAGATGSNGTNGGPGGGGGGSGGGGGGGTIVVIYNTLTANSGTLTVSGGAGGSATTGTGTSDIGTGGGGGGSITAGTNGSTGNRSTGAGGAGGAGGNGQSLVALNTEFA